MSDDDRVQAVLDELDPTPAHEADWPVSRRTALRALASVGALAAVPGASAQSAGTVIADEAVLSNYGSVSTTNGYELTIDGATFGFDGDDVTLPDGTTGTDVVTPSGASAREVIGPDGSVLLGPTIPGSAIHQWEFKEGSGTSVADSIGSADGSISGATWQQVADLKGGYGLLFDGIDDVASFDKIPEIGVSETFAVGMTLNLNTLSSEQYVWLHSDGFGDRVFISVYNSEIKAAYFDGDFKGSTTLNQYSTSNRFRLLVNFDGPNKEIEMFANTTASTVGGGSLNVPETTDGHFVGSDNGAKTTDAVFDNVIIYKNLLTDTEVQQEYDLQPWV